MEQNNKNNEPQNKMSDKKRHILTAVVILLIALSMGAFYGAYYVMYGNGVNTATNVQESSNQVTSDTAKVSDSAEASSDEEETSGEAEKSGEAVETSESNKSSNNQTQTTEGNKNNSTNTDSQPKQETITISISNWGNKTMVYESGDTVYSVLARCGAPVYVEDSVYGIYVVGINGLMEGDKGASSGWTYTVNGSMPMLSADKCKVNPGDKIVWKFVS